MCSINSDKDNQKANNRMTLTQQRQNSDKDNHEANNTNSMTLTQQRQNSDKDNQEANNSLSLTQQHQEFQRYDGTNVPDPQESSISTSSVSIPTTNAQQRRLIEHGQPDADTINKDEDSVAYVLQRQPLFREEVFIRPSNYTRVRETPAVTTQHYFALDRETKPYSSLPKLSVRCGSINWIFLLLLTTALGLVNAQDDCAMLNSWVPTLASSSGCCGQNGLITCNEEGRVTGM